MFDCNMCGMCCWDWKNDDPGNKCEYLEEDMVTCTISGNRSAYGMEGCDDFPYPRNLCDLPNECESMIRWEEEVKNNPTSELAEEINYWLDFYQLSLIGGGVIGGDAEITTE